MKYRRHKQLQSMRTTGKKIHRSSQALVIGMNYYRQLIISCFQFRVPEKNCATPRKEPNTSLSTLSINPATTRHNSVCETFFVGCLKLALRGFKLFTWFSFWFGPILVQFQFMMDVPGSLIISGVAAI